MTVTCAAWARSPHPLCLTAAQWRVSASTPRGNAAKQPEMEMITTTHPPPSTPPLPPSIHPTSLLTENWYLLTNCCQRVSEAERVRAVWVDKKKEKKKRGREMCGKVNVRSPNKPGLMTPRQVSFRCFVADVGNAATLQKEKKKKRKNSSLWKSNDECQKVVERLKSAHHENVYNVRAIMSAETLFWASFPFSIKVSACAQRTPSRVSTFKCFWCCAHMQIAWHLYSTHLKFEAFLLRGGGAAFRRSLRNAVVCE